MKSLRRWFAPLALAVGILGLAGCATVADTGRRQFLLTSPQEEMKMGVAAFAEMKQQTPLSLSPLHNEQVTRIGRRIAAVVSDKLPGAQWEFAVFESPEINAFCLPGGKVGVYTGLIEFTSSDDELAVVIGHEVAHAVARHGGERMSQQMAAQLGLGIAAVVAGANMETRDAQLLMAGLGLGVQVGVLLPFSRTHESEADELGLYYMAQAGYDPRAAITFWQKMNARAGGQKPPEFLSTHPSDETRIARLEALMPRALALRKQMAWIRPPLRVPPMELATAAP